MKRIFLIDIIKFLDYKEPMSSFHWGHFPKKRIAALLMSTRGNRNLDLTTLRSFVAVVDTGGMTSAANKLHSTQSTVSMQIKRLEDSMNLVLLHRGKNGRTITPTAAGEQLLAHARQMLTMNDQIWDRLTAPGFEGNIALGVPSDIIYPHLPRALQQFGRDFPRVRVRLTNARSIDLLQQLPDGKQDIILTTESDVNDGGEILDTRPLVWTGARDGRAWLKRPVPLAIVRACLFRDPVIATLTNMGLGWIDVVDAQSEEPAVVAAAADLGVRADLFGSYFPGLAPVDHGGVLPDLPSFHIVMYVGEGPVKPIAKELSAYLRRAYRDH